MQNNYIICLSFRPMTSRFWSKLPIYHTNYLCRWIYHNWPPSSHFKLFVDRSVYHKWSKIVNQSQKWPHFPNNSIIPSRHKKMPKHGRTIILYIVCLYWWTGGSNFLPKIDVIIVFYRSNRKNYMTGVTNLLRFGSFFLCLN